MPRRGSVCHIVIAVAVRRGRAAAAGGELRRRSPDLGRRLAVAGRGGHRPGPVRRAGGRGAGVAAPPRSVRHSLATLVRQRVFQIACGYEDQNDAATLRADPLLKLVCGRLPETGADLASQPTLSRLENAVRATTCYRLAVALGAVYLAERARLAPGGRPTRILLDLDGTDDPTHGHQEGTAYHGYYGQHMYFPLLVFDGDTDQLVTAVLRPGNAHGSPRRGGRAQAGRPGAADALAGRPRSSCAPTAASPCPPCTPGARPRGSPTPSGSSPTPAWRRSPPRSWRRPRPSRPPPEPRCAWPARRPTRPRAGPARAGWSTRRRPWPTAPTPASWSPPGPTRPWPSTTSTSTGASPSCGSRTSSAPARATASATTASWPTSSGSSCTPPPTGSWTPCAAGSWAPAPSACSWTPCACACSRSAAGCGNCSPASACTSPPATPPSRSGGR